MVADNNDDVLKKLDELEHKLDQLLKEKEESENHTA